MPTAIHTIFSILTSRERKQAVLLLGMMIVMAFIELAGVASIMPFLAVLGNPEMIHTNPILSKAYALIGSPEPQSFLFLLGLFAFVFVVLSSAFKLFTTYAITRFSTMRTYSLSYRLLRTYLQQPYSFFLNQNSADLSKTILDEANLVIGGTLTPLLHIISQTLVIIALIAMLLYMNPVVAIISGVLLGGTYGLIYKLVRNYLKRIGSERVSANKARFMAVNEAIGAIKDIKVLGREQAYIQRFHSSAYRFSRHQANSSILAQMPRHLIEAVGFGGLLALVLSLMAGRQDLGSILPLIGLFAFAAYRILPAAQQLYAAFTQLRFNQAAADNIRHALDQAITPSSKAIIMHGNADSSCPNHSIRFDAVNYSYPKTQRPTLSDISFTIPANSTVGFVGTTGAGKTTVIDLILGLLQPTSGQILIDETPLTTKLIPQWQQQLGYVPQQIYLADASVTENIALGVPVKEIDQQAVEKAANMAQIHDFVIDELPQQYQTIVGERGIRLSGGQRQRIGIARALYHNPSVIVLDEATSALDNETESMVMKSIQALHGNKTVILIAHRLSTVESCDIVFRLEKGRLQSSIVKQQSV